MINIYQTQTMIQASELMPKRPTFLRDRYFPTTSKDIFVTEDVLVEFKDEKSRKMAPFVVPRKGGIAISRDGYKTERYTAPYIAPERSLTIDDLNRKAFGETLFSQASPASREAAILGEDIKDLGELIDTREEWMAAQTLFNNGYALKHYADKYGSGEYEEFEIHFYDGDTNTATYTPSAAWSVTSDAVMEDLYAMAKVLKKRGLKATDVIFGDDVAAVLIKNEHFAKLLDNRRLDLLTINPSELPSGVTYFGRINCLGVALDLFCYSEEYTDESGNTQTFVPAGKIALTAPGMGRTLYGAVTQMEESDRDFHTYAARRVPHVTTDVKGSVRTLTEKARPLTIPNFKDSCIVATVL